MGRFVAERPLLSFALTTIPLVAVQLALAHAVPRLWDLGWLELAVFYLCLMALPMILALPLAAQVTVLRVRSGLSVRRLWWLPAVAAVQMPLCRTVLTVYVSEVREGVSLWPGVEDLLDAGAVSFLAGVAAAMLRAAAAAALGVLLGLFVARWKTRSGRWEKIVPIPLGLVAAIGLAAGLSYAWSVWEASRPAPLPSWLELPPNARVLVSKGVGGGMMYEGPVYYLRFRCPGSPAEVVARLSQELTPAGYGPRRPPQPVSPEVLEYRRNSPELGSLFLTDPPPAGSAMTSVEMSGVSSVAIYAFADGADSIVEVVEDVGL